MSTEPSGDEKGGSRSDPRLPFEPRQKRKKNAKTQPESVPTQSTPKKDKQAPASSPKRDKQASASSPKKDKQALASSPKKDKQASASRESMAIPEVVSKRMIRRMALLSGIPTTLGISTFFVSYFLIANFGLKFPNAVVVLVSMGFFGLGVLGLSYGVLSASWDEDSPGTKLGWQEFTTNLGRMTAAWRSAGQKD